MDIHEDSIRAFRNAGLSNLSESSLIHMASRLLQVGDCDLLRTDALADILWRASHLDPVLIGLSNAGLMESAKFWYSVCVDSPDEQDATLRLCIAPCGEEGAPITTLIMDEPRIIRRLEFSVSTASDDYVSKPLTYIVGRSKILLSVIGAVSGPTNDNVFWAEWVTTELPRLSVYGAELASAYSDWAESMLDMVILEFDGYWRGSIRDQFKNLRQFVERFTQVGFDLGLGIPQMNHELVRRLGVDFHLVATLKYQASMPIQIRYVPPSHSFEVDNVDVKPISKMSNTEAEEVVSKILSRA